MVEWKRDVIFGIALVVFSIVNVIYAGNINEGSVKITMAQAGTYLRIWVILLGALGGILIIRALTKKPGKIMDPVWTKEAIFTVILIFLYLLVMPYTGFLVSSLAFMVIIITAYSKSAKDGEKNQTKKIYLYGKYVLISVLATFATDMIFRNVLGVVLPRFNLF